MRRNTPLRPSQVPSELHRPDWVGAVPCRAQLLNHDQRARQPWALVSHGDETAAANGMIDQIDRTGRIDDTTQDHQTQDRAPALILLATLYADDQVRTYVRLVTAVTGGGNRGQNSTSTPI